MQYVCAKTDSGDQISISSRFNDSEPFPPKIINETSIHSANRESYNSDDDRYYMSVFHLTSGICPESVRGIHSTYMKRHGEI